MYKEVDGITPPEDEVTLWRYMSFEKFASILATEALFFTRADKFEDPFEGFIPQAMMDSHKKSVKRVTPNEATAKMVLTIAENWRNKYVICNCWHQNEEESMAMWEKYHIRNSGIVIKTTARDLKDSLSDKHDVFIGKIGYSSQSTYEDNYTISFAASDLSSHKKGIYFPYFLKRKAFEYENEVRIIIDTQRFIEDHVNKHTRETILEAEFPDICDIGMYFNVNVKRLINEVIISPYAEKWVTDTVRSLVHQYGFDFEVSPSEILDDPTLDDII